MKTFRALPRVLAKGTLVSLLAGTSAVVIAAPFAFRIPLYPLNGTSIPPANGSPGVPTITTGTLAFGSVATSATSAGQATTLTNTGGQPFTITGVTTTSPFAVTKTCVGVSLSAAQSCSETATFKPTATGSVSGTLTFKTTLGNASVGETGTGGTAGVSMPTSLDMGSQFPGTYSPPVALPLTNTGNVPLHVTYTLPNPGITIANDCSTIAAGATCTEYVSETPLGAGNNQENYFVVNSEAGPTNVFTTMTGLYYSDDLDPPSMVFGNVKAGTVSAPKTFQVNNFGNTPDTVYSVTVGAPFQIVSNNCGVLAPGASCSVSVVFAPTATGPFIQFIAVSTTANVAHASNSTGFNITGNGT